MSRLLYVNSIRRRNYVPPSVPLINYETKVNEITQLTAKVTRLEEEIKRLNEKLANRDNFVLVLKIRSRIEELEKKFVPSHNLNTMTRYQKWDAILGSGDNYYVRNPECVAFRHLVGANANTFKQAICDLYGEPIRIKK